MTKLSHLWLGFLSGMVMYNPIQIADKHTAVVAIGACIMGSIMPDIDVRWSMGFDRNYYNNKNYSRGSYINNSKKGSLLTSHRGWTHHIFLPIILILIGLFLHGIYQQALFAFTFGVIIHIFTDMLSPMGIPIWTYKKRVNFVLYKTNTASEFFFVVLATVILFLINSHYFLTLFKY